MKRSTLLNLVLATVAMAQLSGCGGGSSSNGSPSPADQPAGAPPVAEDPLVSGVDQPKTADPDLEPIGAQAAGSAARGAENAEVCALCHGEQGQGNSALGVPRIGGQEDWYVARTLTNFKTGLRAGDNADAYGAAMRAVTQALGDDLTDQMILDLAAYVSSLSPPAGADASSDSASGDDLVQSIMAQLGDGIPDQIAKDLTVNVTALSAATGVSGDVERGKAGYATCVACHGVAGEGNSALNAPRLAGQYDWYIVRQLNNYKSGVRGGNPQNVFAVQMQAMAAVLSTDAINDVAAYINTLQ